VTQGTTPAGAPGLVSNLTVTTSRLFLGPPDTVETVIGFTAPADPVDSLLVRVSRLHAPGSLTMRITSPSALFRQSVTRSAGMSYQAELLVTVCRYNAWGSACLLRVDAPFQVAP